ncbi:MAG: aldehyde dehydrogenase [Schleiferiaceae bacterium]
MNYPDIGKSQRAFFEAGHTRTYAFRRKQLKKLKNAIAAWEDRILDALVSDFGKPRAEGFSSEVGFLYADLSHTIKHLRKWMKPKRVGSPFAVFPSKSYVIREPRGLSFIIAPWNYPFMLAMSPIVSAIASGNTIVLKPSELTSHTAQVMEDMLHDTFPREYVQVIQGDGAQVVPNFIDEALPDHIFFTGSSRVGSIIGQQAAKHLIPATLELGGKSPAIIGESANLKVTAQRIAFSKWLNAGQTCVAPDYVMVHKNIYEPFKEALAAAMKKFYGDSGLDNPDVANIINAQRFGVLSGYLTEGKVVIGGKTDAKNLKIEPTVMEDIVPGAKIMEEEIFGPIMPIMPFSSREEVLTKIADHPNPLALYVYSEKREEQDFYTRNISFGGGAINNGTVHLANSNLPFGGVKGSGIGNYHGRFGFEAFSHTKGLLKTATWIDPALKYPPYTPFTMKLLKLIFR